MKIGVVNSDWQKCRTDVFWGEIAPSDHVLQIYDNEAIFLDSLYGFVIGGFNSGECVVVIATQAHLDSLNHRIKSSGAHLDTLIAIDRYIPLNAEETLSRFMVNGMPDENLFMETISSVMQRVKNRNYKVRAFGEMVVLLWSSGNKEATIQLEQLWNKYCEKEKFCLFCAYPQSGFNQDTNESILHICDKHSKIVSGSKYTHLSNEISFKETARSLA